MASAATGHLDGLHRRCDTGRKKSIMRECVHLKTNSSTAMFDPTSRDQIDLSILRHLRNEPFGVESANFLAPYSHDWHTIEMRRCAHSCERCVSTVIDELRAPVFFLHINHRLLLRGKIA